MLGIGLVTKSVADMWLPQLTLTSLPAHVRVAWPAHLAGEGVAIVALRLRAAANQLQRSLSLAASAAGSYIFPFQLRQAERGTKLRADKAAVCKLRLAPLPPCDAVPDNWNAAARASDGRNACSAAAI